jgi:hypothetical protein
MPTGPTRWLRYTSARSCWRDDRRLPGSVAGDPLYTEIRLETER